MRYLIAALALLPTLALADIAGPAKVIDGHTIEVSGKRIRRHGIGAPEGRQTCQGHFWIDKIPTDNHIRDVTSMKAALEMIDKLAARFASRGK